MGGGREGSALEGEGTSPRKMMCSRVGGVKVKLHTHSRSWLHIVGEA